MSVESCGRSYPLLLLQTSVLPPCFIHDSWVYHFFLVLKHTKKGAIYAMEIPLIDFLIDNLQEKYAWFFKLILSISCLLHHFFFMHYYYYLSHCGERLDSQLLWVRNVMSFLCLQFSQFSICNVKTDVEWYIMLNCYKSHYNF